MFSLSTWSRHFQQFQVSRTSYLLTICILLLGGIQLGRRINDQRRENRTAQAPRFLFPTDSDLHALTAFGSRVGEPGISSTTDDQQASHFLLLFVVHRGRVDREVSFWLQTIRELGATGKAIEYWGICEDPTACPSTGPSSSVRLVGYLPPYQMRIVAMADARRSALLYDSQTLKAEVGPFSDPTAESRAILEHMR